MRSCALALVAVAWSTGAAAATPDDMARRGRQVAEILGVEPLVERMERAAADPQAAEERERLREDAFAELWRVSLLIDGAATKIEHEQFSASTASDAIARHHARRVVTWNIAAVLTSSGVTCVGIGLEFGGGTQEKVGEALEIAGAIAAAALSVVALLQRDRGRAPFAIETAFLARPLGRIPTPESDLPAPIWRYIDTRLEGETSSFRQQLVERWVGEKAISLAPTEEARRRIDELSRPLSRHDLTDAKLLGSRADMLADLRGRVGTMRVDLQLVVDRVRAAARRPVPSLTP